MAALSSKISARVCSSFEDPPVSADSWSNLLHHGDTDAVNLTWHWNRCWWAARARGRLMLIAAYCAGEPIAVAPLFTEGGMVFNLCPEDHLDFVGNISAPEVLDAILETARSCVKDFAGFRFFFIPHSSRTGRQLTAAAGRLGFDCFCETQLASPWLDIENNPDVALRCTVKQSLLRHERALRRDGELRFEVLSNASQVLSALDHFFEQHTARRAATPHPSLFCDSYQREYYRALAQMATAQGWLRFARLIWNGQPIAYHFGLYYRERYLWGVPSFDIQLARYSPGEVLLRHVLLDALQIGAKSFDFGPGDEAYKYRFATDVAQLETWGLYPRNAVGF